MQIGAANFAPMGWQWQSHAPCHFLGVCPHELVRLDDSESKNVVLLYARESSSHQIAHPTESKLVYSLTLSAVSLWKSCSLVTRDAWPVFNSMTLASNAPRDTQSL